MKSVYRLAYCFAVLVCMHSLFANAQTISYIIPDIGAPGMNTMVEIIATHDAVGSFGSDGFYENNEGDAVRVLCANDDDTNKVTIGPVVVSWNGRMISTQIFVHPDQRPPSSYWDAVGADFSIPIRVFANGNFGNSEIFYIVNPQPAIISSTSGSIGSGGIWGLRSRRGAMIVDSIDLRGDQYSISAVDSDPFTPGNQGYLPAVILSRGPVRTGPSTILHVNAIGRHGGPGGGGGGGNFCDWSGAGTDGGDGYTGGGRGGRNRAGNPFGSDEYRNPGNGSGAVLAQTGGSLNGLRGGDAPAYEAAGGGTGHPFGASGRGCADGGGCNPPGGYGGGSGQQQLQNGGGGGYATAGQSSRNNNGGQVHGNAMLVPLAGGSGGASGNPQLAFSCSGEGGGGGGALRLFASQIDAYLLTSHGADGGSGSSAQGGAGSGGAVSAEAKLPSELWRITTSGGGGPGSAGGAGRLRMDGPLSWNSGVPVDAESYFGPSTDTTTFVSRRFRLSGTGNGQDIALFLKSRYSPWTQIATIQGYSNGSWETDIELTNGDGVYFLAALQATTAPGAGAHDAIPHMILSQAAANILISKTHPHITADAPARLPELRCDDVRFDTLLVRNIGEALLFIPDARFIPGNSGFELLQPAVFPVTVAEGETLPFIVRYERQPGRTGLISDDLVIYSNDNEASRNPMILPYEIIVQHAEMTVDHQAVTLADVVLCETTHVDTIIVLKNTGTMPLSIEGALLSETYLSLLSPQASVFPLLLQPDEELPLTLRLSHPSSGTRTATLTLFTDSASCDITAVVTISGTAGDVELSVDAFDDFDDLLCYGEHSERVMRIRNDGDVAVTLTSIVADDAAFGITGPVAPLLLPRGAVADIVIQFRPEQPGDYNASLVLLVQPCDITLVRTLRGRRDSVGATLSSVSFGLLHESAFPAFQTTRITNTGTLPLTLTSITLPPPFALVTPLPITLAAGDDIELLLRFDDPGMDGYHAVRASLLAIPFCDSLYVDIIGERGEAFVELQAGDIQALPGQIVELPVFLRNVRTPRLFGATAISSVLRFDASLLVPMFQNSGMRIGGERSIPITVPLVADAEGVALRLPFMATLGISESTVLQLEQSAAVDGALTILEIPGNFTLLGICEEGGARLFDASAAAGIHANRPNPFNPHTTISYTAIESGQTELYVVDMLGRRVATLFSGIPTAGRHEIHFDASGLASGLYTVVMTTPSQRFFRGIVMAR